MFVRKGFTMIANMGLHLKLQKLAKNRVRAQNNVSYKLCCYIKNISEFVFKNKTIESFYVHS